MTDQCPWYFGGSTFEGAVFTLLRLLHNVTFLPFQTPFHPVHLVCPKIASWNMKVGLSWNWFMIYESGFRGRLTGCQWQPTPGHWTRCCRRRLVWVSRPPSCLAGLTFSAQIHPWTLWSWEAWQILVRVPVCLKLSNKSWGLPTLVDQFKRLTGESYLVLYPPFSPQTWTFSQYWWTCTHLKECG